MRWCTNPGRNGIALTLTSRNVPYMVYGMTTTKTTVYLPVAEYERLKVLAEKEGRSAAELIREAVAEYAQRRAGAARPRSIGIFRGDADLSERTNELLTGFGADE